MESLILTNLPAFLLPQNTSMRFLLSSGLVLACCILSYCQDFDKYTPLLPQGIIPKDFTESSSLKVASAVSAISDKKARVKKAKAKFVLESTFSIDDFLASGNVLFNDEISLYLDQVLKEILKPYPALQGKIRIYAVKSPSVNAFTTNNGIIFVNMGLLARMENEAQLAFVLSHEVIHYQKEHVINAYVTSVEIDQAKGDYKKLTVSEKGFAKTSFSKELEMEADMAGADIYQKSEYSKDSVDRVFDILMHADFPLSWATFNKQLFESGSYIFHDSLAQLKVKQKEVDEDYDDSKSTHPNIKKRRAAVADKFKSGGEGPQFKVSRETFFKVKKLACFELCRQYLLEHRYEESLTLALSLQKDNPASRYLKEAVVKSLYGAARLRIDSTDILEADEDKRWSEAGIFISKLSPYELSVLAIRELYKYMESSPGNPSMSLMLEDLVRDLTKKSEGLRNNFLRGTADSKLTSLNYPYTQYAFLDFKDSKAFFQLFDKQVAAAEKEKNAERVRKKKKRKRASLNASKVVIVHPIYRKVDKRKKQKARHVEAEEVLININDYIIEAADKLDLKVDIINPNKIARTDIGIMQANSLLSDWIDERMLAEDSRLISPVYEEMIALADKHKTDHFMWLGAITVKARKSGKVWIGLGAVLVPSLAPWAVKDIFSTHGATLYFALGFNVRTQQIELIDLRSMTVNDNRPLLQSNIYYTLFNLKK